jgi:hypothetical protein
LSVVRWFETDQAFREGRLVVYADKITRTETNETTGEESEHAILFTKGYTIFNAEQIDGLSDLYYAKPAPPTPTIQRIARVESFFSAMGVVVRNGGNTDILFARAKHATPSGNTSENASCATPKNRPKRAVFAFHRLYVQWLFKILSALDSDTSAAPWLPALCSFSPWFRNFTTCDRSAGVSLALGNAASIWATHIGCFAWANAGAPKNAAPTTSEEASNTFWNIKSSSEIFSFTKEDYLPLAARKQLILQGPTP